MGCVEDLRGKYPRIFSEQSIFEFDSGWYRIADSLCRVINFHVQRLRENRAFALHFNRALSSAINGKSSNLIRIYRAQSRYPENDAISAIDNQSFMLVPTILNDFKIISMKEKFGQLRVYATGSDDFIKGAIIATEYMSTTICECCGTSVPETKITFNLKTRCNNCLQEATNEL